MKKKKLLVVILITSFFFSGCWDYIEYEDMAMVSALGIDFNKDTEKVTVTAEIIGTGKGDGPVQSDGTGQKGDKSKSSSPTIILSAEDVAVSDALAKIQQGIGRRLFFGYQQIIVINEDAARNIMDEITGLLDRTPQIRTTTYLMITPQRCEDILSTVDPGVSGLSSKNIYNLVRVSGETGKSSTVSIKDFIQAMAISGIEAVAPRIIAEGSGSSAEKEVPQKESDSNMQFVKFVDIKEGHHIVEGMAALQKDKLTGWLNAKESLGWTWITGKKLRTYKTTKAPNEAFSKEIVDFRITKSKSSIKPKLENNKPAIDVDVYVEVTIVKSKKGSDYLTPDALKPIEKELSQCIYHDIDISLKKVQKELKTDIFGFGFAFYRKYPRLWHSMYEQEWEELFPDIPVSVNVDAKVINTGTTIRRFIFK